MKNIMLVATVILSLSACKDTQGQKRAACLSMLSAYCDKAEECTEQPASECIEFAASQGVCETEIKSSVKEIQACEHDLDTATCDSPPASCMTLE